MPIKFQCAHCGAPIKAPDTHAGQTLPCPKCGQPVLVMAEPVPPPMANVATSAPPLPGVPPIAPPVAAPTQNTAAPLIIEGIQESESIADSGDLNFGASEPSRPVRNSRRGGETASVPFVSFPLHLLDVRFKYYLTPHIIRVFWVLALILAGMWIVSATIQLFESDSQTLAEQYFDPSPPPRATPDSTSENIKELWHRATMFITKLAALLYLTLSIRVFCEYMMVLFDIAQRVQSIDMDLKQRNP